MPARKVLIVGASGAVGSSLLRQLLALDNPPSIRVSSRNPTNTSFPASVEVVQGDFSDPSSYTRLFTGIDRAFLYVRPGVAFPQLLAAAKEAGVKYIVLLSSMTVEFDPESWIGKMHLDAEEAVRASGLQYTFLRPRNFASNSKAFWVGMMQKTGKLSLVYPNAHAAPVTEDDMAAVGLVALTTDKIVNQAIPLCGPISMSQQEQLEAINRLRKREGKKPIELIVISPEEWKAQSGLDSGFADQLLSWWKESDGKPELIQSSERVTGKPSQTYEEWLELNRDAFLMD
ncbi:hypothetical protein EG329_006846 [Mollisiaceae sp. DMI_Dod_QoI]|nr:hypothetical protein EG329_006846 [Helotiales sp. DMI_Dod_QoI]